MTLEDKESKYQGEIAERVYAFGAQRPMGRIRAYTSAGLQPFGGRGAPSEFHLLGHIHLDKDGKVTRVEGFNGLEGEAWAKQAHVKLVSKNALSIDAVVQPLAPLKACPHTGIK